MSHSRSLLCALMISPHTVASGGKALLVAVDVGFFCCVGAALKALTINDPIPTAALVLKPARVSVGGMM